LRTSSLSLLSENPYSFPFSDDKVLFVLFSIKNETILYRLLCNLIFLSKVHL
jgi:hypothetical protein